MSISENGKFLLHREARREVDDVIREYENALSSDPEFAASHPFYRVGEIDLGNVRAKVKIEIRQAGVDSRDG